MTAPSKVQSKEVPLKKDNPAKDHSQKLQVTISKVPLPTSDTETKKKGLKKTLTVETAAGTPTVSRISDLLSPNGASKDYQEKLKRKKEQQDP